jgi:RimJ/RimL family protein N-acetyltransferase
MVAGAGSQRQGYGTEAVRLALHALHAAGIVEVRIGTSSDNTAVQRVAERLGARPFPAQPHVLPDGTGTVRSRV